MEKEGQEGQEDSNNNNQINLELGSSQTTTQTYVLYRRRWIGLLAIVALNLSYGVSGLTFAVAATKSTKWLNTDLTGVNAFVIASMAVFVFVSPLSSYAFEKWNIKRALLLGCFLNCIGVWIKYLASFIDSDEESNVSRYSVVMTGHIISGASQPFFLNVAAKYSAVWFDDGSRVIATTIASVSNPFANVISNLVIPVINQDDNGEDLPKTLLFVGIIGALAVLPTIGMSAKPPSPPSSSAEDALAMTVPDPFWVSVKKTSKIGQFWIIFAAFSISAGIFNVLASYVNQIVTPYGYSDSQAGIVGATTIICGLISAPVCGIYLDKTKNHKILLKLFAPVLLLGYVALFFAVRKYALPWLCLTTGVIGIVSFALLPVALELGVECTYPNPPSGSSALLWMGGQAMGACLTAAMDQLRDESKPESEDDQPQNNMRRALITMASLMVVPALLSQFYTADNLRLKAEAERRSKAP